MGVLCKGTRKENGQEEESDLHRYWPLSKTAEVMSEGTWQQVIVSKIIVIILDLCSTKDTNWDIGIMLR